MVWFPRQDIRGCSLFLPEVEPDPWALAAQGKATKVSCHLPQLSRLHLLSRSAASTAF
jgi:hypothetical protein